MKKIMFNDKYGLTDAVLQGRKTMTRRNIPTSKYVYINFKEIERGNNNCYYVNDGVADYRKAAYYKIGEVVAVSQRYADLNAQGLLLDDAKHTLANSAGWRNKQSVKANLMPHQILITNVRIERLQDISDEDCMKEGLYQGRIFGKDKYCYYFYDEKKGNEEQCVSYQPRGTYASLIDKISGKDTWKSNPYVFVYEFELIK